MLKSSEKTNLCQISLTGLRALTLLDILMKQPQSLEDIRQTFIKNKLLDKSSPNDVLRIDLNTLRVMGCQITRADKSTGYKYKLLDHPFTLQINEQEINVIRRAYKKIKEFSDIQTILCYDELFKKISNHITDSDLKEKIIGLSALKSYKIDFIKELIEDCKYNRVLELEYGSPASKSVKIMNITAQKVVFKNDKTYLYCCDNNTGNGIVLHIKRILHILNRKSNKDNSTTAKLVNVKFILDKFGASGLDDSENIVEIYNDGRYLIEGNYHNTFQAVQRLLSLGSDCTILEPADLKDKIIELLKRMRDMYNE